MIKQFNMILSIISGFNYISILFIINCNVYIFIKSFCACFEISAKFSISSKKNQSSRLLTICISFARTISTFRLYGRSLSGRASCSSVCASRRSCGSQTRSSWRFHGLLGHLCLFRCHYCIVDSH